MTPYELSEYYARLLIQRFRNKPKAFAQVQGTAAALSMLQTTVQEVSLSAAAASGSVVFGYGSEDTAAIPFNASQADIQTAFRALTGLGSVVVTGRLNLGRFTIKFVGVAPPAPNVIVVSSTLESILASPIKITVSEIDVQLPFAVMDGYNVTGPRPAAGKQLDVLAKYVGVGRTGIGPSGPQTLDDEELYQLILIAIDRNRLTSEFSAIADFLYKWFPNLVQVTDHLDMTMTYAVSITLEATPLWQLFIGFGLLPLPLGVGVNIAIAPPAVDGFFGFRSYDAPNPAVTPFNRYEDYHSNWKYLRYDDV